MNKRPRGVSGVSRTSSRTGEGGARFAPPGATRRRGNRKQGNRNFHLPGQAGGGPVAAGPASGLHGRESATPHPASSLRSVLMA
jgi:hypothetical protein